MMIYKIRVKPFDVLIINRIAKMTSVDCTPQLVDEGQEKRRKSVLQLTEEPSSEGKL